MQGGVGCRRATFERERADDQNFLAREIFILRVGSGETDADDKDVQFEEARVSRDWGVERMYPG